MDTLKNQIDQLFEEQLNGWTLAQNNYRALKYVEEKALNVNGRQYIVQFNPERITSSAAKTDAKSISERPCFLCQANRPAEQKGIPFKDGYIILVNPYPIFSRHLTIPSVEHTPQRIVSRFGDMLDLAFQLDNFIIFYNGPKCGASAPDHFHFQAGSKGFLPVENDRNWNAIRIESESKQEMLQRFRQIYDALPLQSNNSEPMMNILTWYENPIWTTYVFPRKKHRPDCYWAEGEDNMLISLAAVDMGGVLITPLKKDFERITAKNIADILDEIGWSQC